MLQNLGTMYEYRKYKIRVECLLFSFLKVNSAIAPDHRVPRTDAHRGAIYEISWNSSICAGDSVMVGGTGVYL